MISLHFTLFVALNYSCMAVTHFFLYHQFFFSLCVLQVLAQKLQSTRQENTQEDDHPSDPLCLIVSLKLQHDVGSPSEREVPLHSNLTHTHTRKFPVWKIENEKGYWPTQLIASYLFFFFFCSLAVPNEAAQRAQEGRPVDRAQQMVDRILS